MAFTNKPYTSVDSVKAAMDSTATVNDDLIAAFIAQAQVYIDTYLGFSFQTDGTVASPATRIYDGNGGPQLLIDPCLSVAQVFTQTYSFTPTTRTANTPVEITGDCFLGPVGLPYGILLERESTVFPLGKRAITVKGVFGKYPTVPADIQRAATRLVIHMMKQVDANYQNQVAGKDYGVMIFTQDIPSDVHAILCVHKPRIFRGR